MPILAHLIGAAKEQNERFRRNLHNFLLTNHTDFNLYLDGELTQTARLPMPPEHGAIQLTTAMLDALQALLEQFLTAVTPQAISPEMIAAQLAMRARFLRYEADVMLKRADSPLHPFWNMYRQTLFADITVEKFADVYAQTFTYGLFLAWLNTEKHPFDREIALHAVPLAVPPIQVLLEFGGGS